MRIRKLLRPLAAAALLLGAACSDSTGPGEPRAEDLRSTVAAGEGQTGTVGQALADSVVVRVTREGGAPAASLPLEWRALDAGGQVRTAATRTDREGRSANVWVLGTAAGAQRLEVRAVVGGAGVVLDTVQAAAEAGPAVALRVVGDTVRDLVVGDSARLVVEGVDAYGNAIPAAQVQWTSSNPLVALVDASGAARARALGSATLEAQAGAARARLQLRVGGVLEDFVVAPRTRENVGRFVHGAGRTLAVSTTAYHASLYSDVWELEPAGWRKYGIGPWPEGGPTAHPAATGTAYARTLVLFVSPQPGVWRADSSAISRWIRFAGSGGALFGLRTSTPYTWQDYTWRVERWENGTPTDLELPAPYGRKTQHDYQTAIAAAGRQELYLTTAAGTAWWNGSAWAPVARPDGAGPLALLGLTAPADGGPAWGIMGRNLYRVSGGRAERVAHPLESTEEKVYSVSGSASGDPLLVVEGGIRFRVAGEWREHRVPEGFQLQAAGWGAPGTIWLSIRRPTGEMERLV